MKTFGMTLDLIDDPDVISEYCEYHRNVWPDVIEGLSLIGINEMKIFLGGNRLFMYIETSDEFEPGRDFPKYMETGSAKKWDDLMRKFQQKVPSAKPEEWWTEMEEVFNLQWFNNK